MTHPRRADDWQRRDREMLEAIYAYAVQCQAWFPPDTPEYAGATRAVRVLRAALVRVEEKRRPAKGQV